MDSNTEETARKVAAEQAEIGPVTSLEELADRIRLEIAENQMNTAKNDALVAKAYEEGNSYRAMLGSVNRTILLSRESALDDVMQMITGDSESVTEGFPTFG